MSETKLKCFLVTDDGDRSDLVFFETSGQAKSWGATNFDMDFTDVRALRQSQYDKYADTGIVPKEDMLKDGWWFECRCFKQQYEETAIVVNNRVYCEKCAPTTEQATA